MGASSWISYQMGSDDPILDYIFLAEESKDYKKLLQQFCRLQGQIPMIPKWAFGFWMSKCSYMSRKEVEDVVADAEKIWNRYRCNSYRWLAEAGYVWCMGMGYRTFPLNRKK